MLFQTVLAAALVSCAAAAYIEKPRQAPGQIPPESVRITSFTRLATLNDVVPQELPPVPKSAAFRNATIVPKQSTSCSNVGYTFTASGQSAYLQSTNYPFSYPRSQDCSYFISSPAGTRMTFKCDIFRVACSNDYLFYSLDGSSTFQGAKAFCGSGSIATETTTGNSLSIGFHSASSRPFSLLPYVYQCTISVIGTPEPQPTGPTTTTTTIAPPPAGNCSCGVRNVNGATRIVGGVETKAGELPWRVTVFVYNPATGRGGICGGTIISANWVMTAAHCTMDFQPGYRINVYTEAQANPVTVGGGTTVVADRYVQHPAFNRRTLDNDMTLLHLSRPLTFKSNVSPACLPFPLTASDFSGIEVLASGWGTTNPVPINTENNDAVSDTLREVTLPVLSTSECQRYQSVTDNMICTYLPGKDTCQGDSGGSIDYQYTDGRYYAIGVVSFGQGCAQTNYPGVYTKVTKYLPWIQSTTADSFCQAQP